MDDSKTGEKEFINEIVPHTSYFYKSGSYVLFLKKKLFHSDLDAKT